MQKLISELSRLYLPAGVSTPGQLAQRLAGEGGAEPSLYTDDGLTRAIVIAFDKQPGQAEAQHWSRLCEVANVLQSELGLPAPAVSISAISGGFCLWLSLDSPVSNASAQEFIERVRAAYDPGVAASAAPTHLPTHLPPCLNPATGNWSAFINPGLGASFADDAGLEMAPPLAGQLALLQGLESISEAQFQKVFKALAPSPAAQPVARAQQGPGAPAGLLLKDATLEDIVRFLHAKQIEPTFRHLLKE